MSCTCNTHGTYDADGALHLDVRGLECPAPMVEILGAIDRGEAKEVLIVQLDQEPMLLYPELDDRGWIYERLEGHHGHEEGCGGVRLCLRRMRV